MRHDRSIAPPARLAAAALAAILAAPGLSAAPAAVAPAPAAAAPAPAPAASPSAQPAAPPAAPAAIAPAPAAATELTLEKIMSDTDWIGNAPEGPYWADDGRAVYYRQKQQGHELRDLHRVDLATGEARLVPLADEGKADAPGVLSHDRRSKVYVRKGDVYVKDLATGAVRQLTRTAQQAEDPQFMVGDRRISFRDGDNLYIYDLATGLVSQPANLQLKKDPALTAEEPDKNPGLDYLKQQQRRLFDAIRDQRAKEKDKRERDEAERREDPTRAPLPWYLGEEIKIEERSLSPSGDWLLLVTTPKDAKEPKKAQMPNYVTESGFVEQREVRPKVGTAEPIPQSLLLLDLRAHKSHELALDTLPGITVDPLKEMRAKAAAARKQAERESKARRDEQGQKAEKDQKPENDQAAGKDREQGKDAAAGKPKPRPVAVSGIRWSEDGLHAAVELISLDNKDRWIAVVEPAEHRLASRHHLSDPAWISWDNNDFGWLRDSATIYYLSEETGWFHLYLAPLAGGPPRALTSGKYEVTAPELASDGRYLYFLANTAHPGNHEVWRAEVASGRTEQVTRLGGSNVFELSADGEQLLLAHSEIAHPPELYVQDARPGAAPRRLTATTSAEFLAQDWTVPEVVAIPSSHVPRPIYARLYRPRPPAANTANTARHPAVLFVQNYGSQNDIEPKRFCEFSWSRSGGSVRRRTGDSGGVRGQDQGDCIRWPGSFRCAACCHSSRAGLSWTRRRDERPMADATV